MKLLAGGVREGLFEGLPASPPSPGGVREGWLKVPLAPIPAPSALKFFVSSLAGPVSCSLNSIIFREQDDSQNRTGVHDLLQNRRVPGRVPSCADSRPDLENRVWRVPCSYFPSVCWACAIVCLRPSHPRAVKFADPIGVS